MTSRDMTVLSVLLGLLAAAAVSPGLFTTPLLLLVWER